MRNQNYVYLGDMKSRSSYIYNIVNNLDDMAASNLNIMVTGDRGTGRDTVAKELHRRSPQAGEPMQVITCMTAKDEDIELSPGCLIYIDRVNLLNRRLQRRLLSLLKQAHDVRVVSSADADIGQMMAEDRFYTELHAMLAQAAIELPALALRREDIPMLARQALSKYNKDYGKKVKIESGALSLLKKYNFKCNVKELFSIIERAVLVNKSGVIKANSVMSILDMENVIFATLMKDSSLSYKSEMERFEKELIATALANTGSTHRAAAQLGVSQAFVYKRCKYYGIELKGSSENADYK